MTGDVSQVLIHRRQARRCHLHPETGGLPRPTNRFTDIDADASGRLYHSRLGRSRLQRQRQRKATSSRESFPKDWKYTAAPKFKELADDALVSLLRSDSATVRLHTQQEILNREARHRYRQYSPSPPTPPPACESRVAAIFTYAQLLGEKANAGLASLTNDTKVREFALRALADRKPLSNKAPIEPFLAGLQDKNPRVQAVAAIGLGRIGRADTAKALLSVASPASPDESLYSKRPPGRTARHPTLRCGNTSPCRAIPRLPQCHRGLPRCH